MLRRRLSAGNEGLVYQQDYILRLIEQVGIVLRRMVALSSKDNAEDALDASTEAMGLLLDMDPSFVESLSPASLVSLLGAGGRIDSKRTLLLGQVFLARSSARAEAGDAAGAASERGKAEALLQAVIDLGDAEDAVRAGELLGETA